MHKRDATMPVILTSSRTDKGTTMKYHMSFFVPLNDKVADYLMLWRKHTIEEREYWLNLQKEAAKEKDFPLAKYCSEQSKEWLKCYRAVCLLIPYYCATPLPGDCPERNTYDFPPELFPYLEEIEMSASAL